MKTRDVSNGRLYTVIKSQRFLLAKCDASIELIEHSKNIPILGTGNIINKRMVTMLVTFNQKPNDVSGIDTIELISFKSEVLRCDGRLVPITFENCLIVSDLDLTAEGQCTFEVACSESTLKMLLNI